MVPFSGRIEQHHPRWFREGRIETVNIFIIIHLLVSGYKLGAENQSSSLYVCQNKSKVDKRENLGAISTYVLNLKILLKGGLVTVMNRLRRRSIMSPPYKTSASIQINED